MNDKEKISRTLWMTWKSYNIIYNTLKGENEYVCNICDINRRRVMELIEYLEQVKE